MDASLRPALEPWMTSHDPERPAPAPEASRSGDLRQRLAERMESMGKLKVPPPKGRGIVLIAVGLVLLYSLIKTLSGSSAIGDRLRKDIEEREKPPVTAPEGPAPTKPPPTSPATPPGTGVPGSPVPAPAPDVKRPMEVEGEDGGARPPVRAPVPDLGVSVPAGIPEGIARRLQLSIASLSQGRLIAEAGLRDLPSIVEASGESKAAVRAFVLESLRRVLGTRLAAPALESAAWLAVGAETPSEAALRAIRDHAAAAGVEDDETAGAALLFLDALADRGGEPGIKARERVLLAGARPVHLRVLAGRGIAPDQRSEAVRRLAENPETHPAVREALR
jgi:hypothetical protein